MGEREINERVIEAEPGRVIITCADCRRKVATAVNTDWWIDMAMTVLGRDHRGHGLKVMTAEEYYGGETDRMVEEYYEALLRVYGVFWFSAQ